MAQRAQRRARQAEAARRVGIPASVDVCVVGGGAAGLVTAVVAAEHGARVVVLERDLECGRSILATGNGRCNFANAGVNPEVYNKPDFVRAVVGTSWLEDVLGFFRDCGLAWEEEAEGRLYPLSRQAASVRNVLLARAKRAGVVLACGRETLDVRRGEDGHGGVVRGTRDGHPDCCDDSGHGCTVRHVHDNMKLTQEDLDRRPSSAWFDVRYAESFGQRETRSQHAAKSLRARTVVIASGGGTRPCEKLGLPVVPFEPVLCPLACEGPLLTELDGRRVRAEVRLLRRGTEVTRERGEVLFRPYGLSGIVVFDLSRHARPGDDVLLDLLPGLSFGEASRYAATTLDGLLDPVVAQALSYYGHASHRRTNEEVLTRAKELRYVVTGAAETGRAQVTRGGFAVDAFDAGTLESHAVPGLFTCGEVLDVDGPCGGYNLAWAWKSGMVAGVGAASRAEKRRGKETA